MTRITIIGAGLTGTLLAIYLANRGYAISLFDKRPDPRLGQIDSGRSINLALSTRGMCALAEVGLLDAILTDAVPVYGRKMHDRHGKLTSQAYGRNEHEHNYAISRANLNLALLKAAATYPAIECYFNHTLTSYDAASQTLTFNNNSAQIITQQADWVIGADGAFSTLRSEMARQSNCRYQIHQQAYGYKELLIKAEYDTTLTDNELHIWPREQFMLMSLANPDGSHTLTLYLPHQGKVSFQSLTNANEIKSFFSAEFADVVPLLPNLTEQFLTNPSSPLVYAKVDNYFIKNKSLLIGDAAHPMVPFLGQGMNCGFEDVRLLCQYLDNPDIKPSTLFEHYYQQRKPNTDAIIQMALDNYDEMRSAVGQPDFLLQKQIEQAIMQRYPEQYIAKYVLISYSHTPYQVVQQLAIKQQKMLQALSEKYSCVEDIEWDGFEQQWLMA